MSDAKTRLSLNECAAEAKDLLYLGLQYSTSKRQRKIVYRTRMIVRSLSH